MSAKKKTFRVKLGSEVHALFFVVPFELKAVFGRARPPLRVTVNGYVYRTTPAIYSGVTYVPVRREHREAAGVEVGEVVRVSLELDTEPRVVKVPRALAAALKKDARAKRAWAALSYSHQREHALAIEGAKRPETRARRVAKALELLHGRK